VSSQSITICRAVFSGIRFINFCHPNMVKLGYKGVHVLAQLAPSADSSSPVAEQADTFPQVV